MKMSSNKSIFREHWQCPYGRSNSQLLYSRTKGSLDFVQRLKLETKLEVHNGCVNTICWNEKGNWILSGSDDQRLCITDPYTQKPVTSIQSGHFANIFSAKFLPNTEDNQVVSCSGDGMIQYTTVDRPDQYGEHPFDCHFGTTYELVTVPQDRHTFLSCGEDGTVRWFDLRIKDKCVKDECKEDILINCRRAVTALAINPLLPYQLSVGCSDSTVRIFDRRMLGTRATGNYTGRSSVTGMVSRFTAPMLEGHSHRITSLSYSTDGIEVLASFSSEQIYLFNLNEDGKKEFQKDVTKTPQELKNGATAEVSTSSSPRHPPIKRLRLRGDWSDTGPNARPERERGSSQPAQPAEAEGEASQEEASREEAPPPPEEPAAGAEAQPRSVTIMQRMSDMLTRWLEGATRQADQQRNNQPGTQPTEEQNTSEAQDGPSAGPAAAGRPSEQEGGGEQISGQQRDDTGAGGGEAEEARPKDESEDAATSQQHANSENSIKAECSSQNDNGNSAKAGSCHPQREPGVVKETVEKSNVVVLEKKEIPQGVSDSQGQSEESSQSTTVIESESHGGLGETNQEAASRAGSCSDTHASNEHEQVVSSVGTQQVSASLGAGQSVEPLVSLRYTPQGTSAGTIRVDFPESGTEAGPNLPPDVSTYSNHGKVTDNKRPAVKVTSSASRSTSEERKSDAASVVNPSQVTDAASENISASASDAKNRGNSVEELMTATEPVKVCHLDKDSVKVNQAGPSRSGSQPQSKVSDKEEEADSDEEEEAASLSQRPDSSHVLKYSPSDDFSDQSATPEDAPSSSAAAPGGSAGGDDETPRRLPSANRGAVATARGGRQRRHGRSGPPTGDFQLHSASDDSDEEVVTAAARNDRDDIERNLAALRLQELYRKRQDEREREEQQLLNIHQPALKHVYRGHRNARTMIKESAFWGEQFVMSGSDCGHIFVWDRYTSELVMVLEGDKHVVNCLQPHPFDPVLASSGIDYDIKLWMPTEETPNFDREKAEEVVSRNRVMLEETRDTITVPASFMLRMLASLNHIRSGRRQGDGSSSSSGED